MNSCHILTRQEERIARAFVDGKISKEVALELNVSENTVKNHVQNIYDKTEIPRCLNALVSWWYRTNFPEVAQKVGAMILVLGLVLNIYTQEPQRRIRRAARRQRIEFIETVTAA